MRTTADRGRIYRRCGCRDTHRHRLGAHCPHFLTDGHHGTWTFAVDLPAPRHHWTTVRVGVEPAGLALLELPQRELCCIMAAEPAPAAALIVPSLAGSLTAVLDQRKLLAARIEELLEKHPLSKVLTSTPGIGVRTGARILIDVGDGSSFPSAAHLAAYAGPAPATRSSDSSIRSEQPSRRVE